jgi:oxygen-dependent protoporphyrinogen oxidase
VPDSSPSPPLRLAIVGGGISGLAAAHRLHQMLPTADLKLFEADTRLGGPLDTQRSGDLVLEQGADSFQTRDPWAIDLCRELGLEAELLPTSVENRRALVVCRGRLAPTPDGFVIMQPHDTRAMLRSPVLSARGKLRLLAERWVRTPAGAGTMGYDESVASFATRRLGRETFERLVEPLLAGIYVADAANLSLAATMPEFLAAERVHGSLRRARLAAPSKNGDGAGARYGAFVTFKSGMGRLVEALADALPAGVVQLDSPVGEVAKTAEGRWVVSQVTGQPSAFDGVIIAAPAGRAARMLERLDPQLGNSLARITAASSVVVTLVYARDQIARPLDGFGFVVPRVENRKVVAGSFPSVKFAGRGTAELTPVRVFLGGALHPRAIDGSDADLIAIAQGELADLIGASGAPRETHVARWRQAMPQYRVGHLELVGAIEHRVGVHRGLELAGASYRGVGIPQCIRSGRGAAERLAEVLASPR